MVPNHPQDCFDVDDIYLNRKDTTDHRFINIRTQNRTERFLVIIPVKRAFKPAKITSPRKIRKCLSKRSCPRNTPRCKQIDYCLWIRLSDKFGKDRFIKFACGDETVKDLLVCHVDILTTENCLDVLDVPPVEKDCNVVFGFLDFGKLQDLAERTDKIFPQRVFDTSYSAYRPRASIISSRYGVFSSSLMRESISGWRIRLSRVW